MMIIAIATTNSGSAVTASASTELVWSSSESLRSATTAPSVTPTTLPITPESPTRVAELAAAGPTMLQTGIPLTRLVPGWPPRIPEIHEPYWTSTDRLRWSCRSRACTADGVAEWPRMAMAALPGRTWVAAKITTETTHNVTTPSATRWTRSLTIGCGARAPLLRLLMTKTRSPRS